MTKRSIKDVIGRRLVIGSAVFALATGLVSAVVLSSSATPDVAAAEVAATLTGELAADDGAGANSADKAEAKENHAKLRANLKAARQLKGDDREAAFAKIRADVKAGKYGERAEKRFAHRFGKHGKHGDRNKARHAAFFALLPDELQADLKKARAAEPDDRKQMLQDIRKKAVDGGYGDKVQEAAKLLKGQKFWPAPRPGF